MCSLCRFYSDSERVFKKKQLASGHRTDKKNCHTAQIIFLVNEPVAQKNSKYPSIKQKTEESYEISPGG